MKTFTIFYNHVDYGYYATTIDANDIVEALNEFNDNYVHGRIYGIMETN